MPVLCYGKERVSACPAMHLVYLHLPFPKINTPCAFSALSAQNPTLNKRFRTNTGRSGTQVGLHLQQMDGTCLSWVTMAHPSYPADQGAAQTPVLLRCSDASWFLWQGSMEMMPSRSASSAPAPSALWSQYVLGAAGSVIAVWVFLPCASTQV